MANENYVSAINSDALFVPLKAATVYAAHEASLFLGGSLIPVVNAPNGVLQVPELAAVTAQTVSAETNADLESRLPADTKNTITCNLYGARSVVRDLGNIDLQEIGRSLGNAVAKAFDEDVMGVIGANTTEQENTESSRDLTVDEIFKAVGTIRGNGEMGQLYGIVSTSVYSELMKDIGSTSYAGGDFQTEALRTGFMGNIGGVQMFVSSYLNDTNTGLTSHNVQCAIFGADAYRIAMQANVNIEVQRRAAAVGNDVVASLHAKAGAIDAGRSVLIIDESA